MRETGLSIRKGKKHVPSVAQARRKGAYRFFKQPKDPCEASPYCSASAVNKSLEALEQQQMLSTYYVNDNWVEQVERHPGGTAVLSKRAIS